MPVARLLSKVHRGRMRLSLPMQLITGFTPAFLLVCLASYLVYAELREARVRTIAASDAVQTISLHHSLIKAVIDAETGERGFLLTGDREFLEPYRLAREEFADRADALANAYSNDSAAMERLDRIRHSFEYWNEGVAQPLIEARQRTPPELDQRTDRLRDRFARITERLQSAEANGGLPDGLLPDLADALARLELLAERADDTLFASQYRTGIERGRELRSSLARVEEDGLTASGLDAAEQSARSLLAAMDTLSETIAAADYGIVERVRSGAGKRIVDLIRDLNDQMIENRRADREAAAEAADSEMVKAMWTGVAAPLAAFLLGIAAMAIVAARAVRRIHQVQAVADEIARGNLAARVSVSVQGDELNELGQSFNRMAAELEAGHSDTELMGRFRDLLASSASTEEAFRVMERMAPALFPGTEGRIYLIAESRNVAMPMAAWPGAVEHQATLRPSDCRGLRAGRTHVVSPDNVSVVCPHLEPIMPAASVCVPLTAQDTVLGLLTLWPHEPEDGEPALSRIDDERALRVGEQLALFLANVRLREQLRNQSIRDPLTDLFNRRYLDETLERELERVRRHGSSLSAIALDIDHFKRFNDAHGHDAGDAVLVGLAAEMQRWLRGSDIACRTGGEEFLLVLPDAPLAVARERAERLREAVGDLVISHQGHELPRVTISLGVAAVPDHAHSTEKLLRRADGALYAAKRNGRNRVEIPPAEEST